MPLAIARTNETGKHYHIIELTGEVLRGDESNKRARLTDELIKSVPLYILKDFVSITIRQDGSSWPVQFMTVNMQENQYGLMNVGGTIEALAPNEYAVTEGLVAIAFSQFRHLAEIEDLFTRRYADDSRGKWREL